MTSVLPPFVQAVSGSLGAASANASTYPLDVITTRIQANKSQSLRKLLTAYRLSSLYDGLLTDAGATLLSSFVYYYAYSFLRALFARGKSKTAILAVSEELAIGYFSGILSRAVTTPLSIITVRMQTEREVDLDGVELHDSPRSTTSLSFRAVCKQIHDEAGLRGFWKGFTTTFLLSLNPAITLYLFQLFRRVVLKGRDRAAPPPSRAFIGGALANSVAVTLLYPLILAKTLIQATRKSSDVDLPPTKPQSTHTIRGTLKDIYAANGALGLYRGLSSQIFKGVLRQGTAMMVKQRIEQLVIRGYLKQRELRGRG
ncbi:mitochondrial carrier [Paxillus ammoniavirescens]|nr:mitochondrial carrier [Paxillus ammoniavirescens]